MAMLALGLQAFSPSKAAHTTRAAPRPRIERLYRVPASEGVFAYGRISPDGRYLAYTAQRYEGAVRQSRVQTIIDVTTGTPIFSEFGFDGYWSPDGQRLIFMSRRERTDSVSVFNIETRHVTRNIAPTNLGDYPSWARHAGRDLILTILNNYYYLDSAGRGLDVRRVKSCGDIGTGERPLISKQGSLMSTFVEGEVVVRHLDDCEGMIRTRLSGAKADFSFDGRFLAFHAEKDEGIGYDVRIVDLQQRSMTAITGLPGSSLFPSWTADGRLVLRYDDADFRGFVMASGVLTGEFEPLPIEGPAERIARNQIRWRDLFAGPDVSRDGLALVLVWAPWNVHSAEAIRNLSHARLAMHALDADMRVSMALEPSSWPNDADDTRREAGVSLPEVRMRPGRVAGSPAANQIPSFLLFEDGQLVESLLGAQHPSTLIEWIRRHAGP